MKKFAVSALIAATLMTGLAACGEEPIVGPDTRGQTLPKAIKMLDDAGIGHVEHAKDAAFGILVPENFVVCEQVKVNAISVRLEVAKHGCED
jgi:hypothetical protein